MQNWKKVILLLIVLMPSVFFLSKAFSSNDVYVENDELVIKGAGGLEIGLDKIQSAEMVDTLPPLDGTGGFSLGLIKKGNFIRSSDKQQVRVIKNSGAAFIHLTTEKLEVYFNLDSQEETTNIFKRLR